MPYVLIKPELAESFNRGLYRLTRPNSVRNPDDVTDTYCNVLYHPTNGWAALELPDVDDVRIHPQATGDEMQSTLDTFVADGALTRGDVSGLRSAIASQRNKRVKIKDFVPASWRARVMTRAQMEADGWFPEEETP